MIRLAAGVTCVLLVGTPAVSMMSDPMPFRVSRAGAAMLRMQATVQVSWPLPATLRCGGGAAAVLVATSSSEGPGWILVDTRPVSGQTVRVGGIPGRRTLLVLRCPGHRGYFLHGPLRWSADAGRTPLDIQRRRTVRVAGTGRQRAGGSPVLVTRNSDRRSVWPQCLRRDENQWDCIGVPLSDAALVLMDRPLEWGVAGPGQVSEQTLQLQPATWGRLFSLHASDSRALETVSATVSVPRPTREGRTRLRVSLVPSQSVAAVRVGTFLWVVGPEPPWGAILEMRGPHVATTRVGLGPLSQIEPLTPYAVTLDSPSVLTGRVTGRSSQPISGAVVSVFEELAAGRTIAKSALHGDQQVPTRWVADAVSDSDGRFQLHGLSRAVAYEIVVVHPEHGRVTVRRPLGTGFLQVRLEPGRQVRGRVLSRHVPVAGVPIRVVPDTQTYETADDRVAVTAPAGASDAQGRFVVSLPAQGSGTLIVGDPHTGRLRVPYHSSPATPAVTDLGDLALTPPIELSVAWIGPSCELFAVGPLDGFGIEVVRAHPLANNRRRLRVPERGLWSLHATCARPIAGVIPAIIDVTDDLALTELTVQIRGLPPDH